MEVALFPRDVPSELVEALRLTGLAGTPVADVADLMERQPVDGWAALVVVLEDHQAGSLRALSTARRARQALGVPVLAVAGRGMAIHLEAHEVDDFVLTPPDPFELALRLRRLATPAGEEPEVVRFKDLAIETATYQATVGERPLDLTYMEYELLRFFAENPKRVWSREQLLANVWGYDYFGGSRTVDVHVRRLRAKLGEERAGWITTVRSVGYRFG